MKDFVHTITASAGTAERKGPRARYVPVACVTTTDVPAHSELEMVVETLKVQRVTGYWKVSQITGCR